MKRITQYGEEALQDMWEPLLKRKQTSIWHDFLHIHLDSVQEDDCECGKDAEV